ncbi:acyl carrier protein [Iodobacter sp. LRB]|uniref:acyl carrier protein n=1 Tax=unclassified Iodobacter TaxID=235634 RepID=UPI000C11374D|nr:acyl carrier protein [Iodobacter sp. BJB302]PHV03471.1 acyl carrier protein [Iodobacter sp. BJB302]
MDNSKKIRQAFAKSLNIDVDTIKDELAYNSIPEWDSIAHMVLVAELENIFDVMLDTDDIIDMSSFAKAKEILAKYHVVFD